MLGQSKPAIILVLDIPYDIACRKLTRPNIRKHKGPRRKTTPSDRRRVKSSAIRRQLLFGLEDDLQPSAPVAMLDVRSKDTRTPAQKTGLIEWVSIITTLLGSSLISSRPEVFPEQAKIIYSPAANLLVQQISLVPVSPG